MVYRVRLTLLAIVLVVLVLGFLALRHDLHNTKAELSSVTGPIPVEVWGYSVSVMKHLYGIVETGTVQMLANHQNASQISNGINSA